ncbi:MAG: RNA polymerase sigma factor [Bacteroidales bacterium]|nr:RNA polymerase sigma factor [Bacteroidales bacterium]HOK98930.1 RNA polymerase sigma factor [Bacteroidales bacterium]HPO66405.1 RNA polymerase sigma factor [Bacteroidales bacterium]
MTVAEYNLSVEQYADNIYRFILKNIKDEEKAKDIVQDTYEKLWLKIDSVSFEKVRSYLFTTAYHTMIDLIRREKKQVDFEQINVNHYAHSEHYSDIQEILHQAIEKLPPAQKSVILLRDYEGYSYDEIAQITGLSEAQVKVYIYRGRMFLKNYLVSLETLI